jgi:hypothetical protein
VDNMRRLRAAEGRHTAGGAGHLQEKGLGVLPARRRAGGPDRGGRAVFFRGKRRGGLDGGTGTGQGGRAAGREDIWHDAGAARRRYREGE